jgi:tetratricopeptide (TPR) repeat protein
LLRKFPRLKTLDVDTVPAAQKAEVRDRLLMERMKRSSEKGKKIVKKGAVPIFKLIARAVKALFRKIYDLEKKYKKEAEDKTELRGGALKNKVGGLVEEARKLVKDDKLKEAEKLYIEVVSLDVKNIEAYRGLADVYLKLKEYKQAEQTSAFVLRLEKKLSKEIEKKDDNGQLRKTVSNAPELANAYVDLGYTFEMQGNLQKAVDNFAEALNLEPNNPRNITEMLDAVIAMKNKSAALDMLKRLEQVNPENQKLKEYHDVITAL